jgi:hypothetical protein
LASAPQWEAVGAFLRSLGGEEADASVDPMQQDKEQEPAMKIEQEAGAVGGTSHENPSAPQAAAPTATPASASAASPAPIGATPAGSAQTIFSAATSAAAAPVGGSMSIGAHPVDDADAAEVIELPAGAGESAILDAVVGQGRQFIQCPVKPPKCEHVMLAVSRDRRLTMLAVAGKGLTDLRSIGAAFGWLVENRGLVAMALPQFAIDAHGMPALRLLVDHADVGEDVLQPILSSGTVTVQAYRKLRWGTRTGLLLEAA